MNAEKEVILLLEQILKRLKSIDDSIYSFQSSMEMNHVSIGEILREQLRAIQNINEDS